MGRGRRLGVEGLQICRNHRWPKFCPDCVFWNVKCLPTQIYSDHTKSHSNQQACFYYHRVVQKSKGLIPELGGMKKLTFHNPPLSLGKAMIFHCSKMLLNSINFRYYWGGETSSYLKDGWCLAVHFKQCNNIFSEIQSISRFWNVQEGETKRLLISSTEPQFRNVQC